MRFEEVVGGWGLSFWWRSDGVTGRDCWWRGLVSLLYWYWYWWVKGELGPVWRPRARRTSFIAALCPPTVTPLVSTDFRKGNRVCNRADDILARKSAQFPGDPVLVSEAPFTVKFKWPGPFRGAVDLPCRAAPRQAVFTKCSALIALPIFAIEALFSVYVLSD